MKAPFFTASSDGVRIRVRVQPQAGRNRIDGIASDGDGNAVLKCAVTPPAEGGKANRALIRLLAGEWRLPKSTFTVARGATSRHKLLAVEGGAELADIIARWAKQQGF